MHPMLSENFLVGITGEVNKNRLIALEKLGGLNAKMDIFQLPFCLRVVLESNLRHCKSEQELRSTIDLFANWQEASKQSSSINIYATRVLMQDYTGIPVLVDLCALRQAAINKGVDPEQINPRIPVDLVVDHSIVVNSSGNSLAATENSRQQYEQNIERFSFLKWVSHAFKNLRIIPPDSGICHQVNLESLATAYVLEQGDEVINLFPELVIGADSHTTTINSLGVLGWGVGGIEALGASLGESLNIPMPEVIGVRLSGQLGAVEHDH
jgi:aconitate hydratase